MADARETRKLGTRLTWTILVNTSTVPSAVDVNGPTAIESPVSNKRNFTPAYHKNVSNNQLTSMVRSGARVARESCGCGGGGGGGGACYYHAGTGRKLATSVVCFSEAPFEYRPIDQSTAALRTGLSRRARLSMLRTGHDKRGKSGKPTRL